MWQEPVWDGARCAMDELSVLVIKTCKWRSVGRQVDGWEEGPLNGSMCELSDLLIGSARWMVGKQRDPQSWSETGRHRYRARQVVPAREDILPSVLQPSEWKDILPSVLQPSEWKDGLLSVLQPSEWKGGLLSHEDNEGVRPE